MSDTQEAGKPSRQEIEAQAQQVLDAGVEVDAEAKGRSVDGAGLGVSNMAKLGLLAAGGGIAAGVVVAAGMLWWQGAPPKLAVMDLREVMEIEETRLTLMVARPGTGDEERMKAYARLQGFGDELTRAIKEVQAECKCTLLNRSAYIGEVPRDYTPELKVKLGMGDLDLAQLKQLTAETVKASLPSVDLLQSGKGR